jgi:hypothetical protein
MKPALCIMRTQGWTDHTVDSFLQHIMGRSKHVWGLCPTPADVDVARARSGVATNFTMEMLDYDPLIMIDYDVSWSTKSGDLDYLAEKCLELDAIVGAVVCKKEYRKGFGCRFNDGLPHELYTDEIVELGPHSYMGGAFTAYPRSLFTALQKVTPCCKPQQFWPFFLPCIVKNPIVDTYEYLSEDWSICEYARKLAGQKVYAAMRPCVGHWGHTEYLAIHGTATLSEVGGMTL